MVEGIEISTISVTVLSEADVLGVIIGIHAFSGAVERAFYDAYALFSARIQQ